MLQGQAHSNAFFVFLDCIALIYIKYSEIHQVGTRASGHQVLNLACGNAGVDDESEVTPHFREAGKLLHCRNASLLQGIQLDLEQVDTAVDVEFTLQCRVECPDQPDRAPVHLNERGLPPVQGGMLALAEAETEAVAGHIDQRLNISFNIKEIQLFFYV